jgi:hydrogenase-4 transcriptional activator
MDELELEKALVAGWQHAAASPNLTDFLEGTLKNIRRLVPIESVVLQQLDVATRSIQTIAVAGGFLARSAANASTICTEAKWNSLEEWTRTGNLLVQVGPRRTGKLSILVPSIIHDESLAIPLRASRIEPGAAELATGAVIFEIESSRSLREEQLRFLDRWRGPFWLALERSYYSKWRNSADQRDAEVSAPSFPSNDDAREAIVGADTGLRAVMERVQVVAPSDMPVLILGETGTGKEVVARAIHGRSYRHSRPFVRVNCGAIPTELIDSQLFGHERGSFTGASDQRKGWFERADGGTLFLDEIGELPLAAQVRLLRVLQDHQIERVGGQEHIHVDVRIVAATHRDLSAMVHRRTFREDLWYRINMFPILLPGLRDRAEDIPSLARHFARRAADRFGLHYVEPTPTDIKQLMDYRWPGNIRELQAVIDRAVILGGGSHIDVAKSLGNTFIQLSFPSSESNEPTYYEVIPESMPLKVSASPASVSREEEGPVDSLDAAMVRHIERALAATNGQIEGRRGAAQMLGVNPHTLRAKMRKLEIEWERFRR